MNPLIAKGVGNDIVYTNLCRLPLGASMDSHNMSKGNYKQRLDASLYTGSS